MRTYQATILLLSVSIFASPTFAKGPTPTHQRVSTELENSINWSEHLRAESKKKGKMDRKHVAEEIQNVRSSFSSLDKSTQELAKESPSDVAEGHFQAMMDHQRKAARLIDEFEAESAKAAPDYAKMKNQAEKAVDELKSARDQHRLELTEIEQHPQNR